MEKQSEQFSEQEEIKEIITSREDGFGHRLKIVRNEKNLSTADVARELRLDEKIILALEAEDYARLPVSAFVCGYIRNYAKFLHIQPEPLVEYYKKEISEEEVDTELKITKGKELRRGVDVSRFMMPVLLVCFLALMTFGGWKLWFYISNNYMATDVAESTSAGPDVAASQDSIAEQSAEAQDSDPDSLSLPVPDDSYYVPPAEEELSEQAPEAVPESEPSASDAGTAVSSPAETVATLPEPAQASETVVTETVTTETSISTPVENDNSVPASDNRLFLEFSGNSWIIIKDANNKKLATGLKKAGQSLQLEGKRPYHVFLGDGRVVKVSIHGKIYDHSQHINQKNIARFNVE